MATLPDLDTSAIGQIAYWNAIDQGQVTSIDPEEVLTDSRVGNYSIYDNGVEGDYTLLTGRVVTFRVKNDGWMIIYSDRTNTFLQDQTDDRNIPGYWDFINRWDDTNGPSDIQNSTFERGINSLRRELPNSDSMTYNSGDVGIYNYEYSSATTMTMLSHWQGASYEGGTVTDSGGFAYTSGTTLDWMAATTALNGRQSNSRANLEGVTIAATENVGQSQAWGSIDVLGRGLVPNASTEYNLDSTRDGAGYQDTAGEFNSQLFTMWH